ncbi:putative small lipoprotein YifL [Halomonas fontilapidosi]|uniref:Putative small lipoprotein YifL n=1 Tax=Halomonas fontilapidosi TaxID=616675 RepID=A0A7W5DK50_9GAMM|nr:lipoprotein [Halomonas fontilapidosi]MBB3184417.1 putative small lipoprotein YifL [Halomonas fontilapidosi]
MPRLAPLTMALVVALALAGCGQKGPLYLPGDEAAAERYDPAGQQDDDTARDDES